MIKTKILDLPNDIWRVCFSFPDPECHALNSTKFMQKMRGDIFWFFKEEVWRQEIDAHAEDQVNQTFHTL